MVHQRARSSSLAVAMLLAMTTWFSASALIPQLKVEWALSSTASAWLTIAVQVGFVLGALVSAAATGPPGGQTGFRLGPSVVGELYLADISVPPAVYSGLGHEVAPVFARGSVLRVRESGALSRVL